MAGQNTAAIIIQQLKRLGCSCDWSRQRYNTFDDDYVRAVEKIFVDLYKKKTDLSRPPHDQLGPGPRKNRVVG